MYVSNGSLTASGGTTLNAGNLTGNASALGSGVLTLNGGTLSVQTGTVSIQGGVLNVNTAQQAMLNDLQQQAGKEEGRAQEDQKVADLQGKITLNADVAAQTAARYRDRLVAQQKQQQEVVGVGGGGNRIGGFEGLGEGRGRGGFGGGGGEAQAAERPAAPAPPTGLASLDVDLPPRGIVYRFTAPRDVPEITGRVVSQQWLDSLLRLGEALLLAVAALLLWRFIRRSYTPLALSRISTAMIFLGVVGLIVGILPLASVAVAFWGAIIKIRLRLARRRAVAA